MPNASCECATAREGRVRLRSHPIQSLSSSSPDRPCVPPSYGASGCRERMSPGHSTQNQWPSVRCTSIDSDRQRGSSIAASANTGASMSIGCQPGTQWNMPPDLQATHGRPASGVGTLFAAGAVGAATAAPDAMSQCGSKSSMKRRQSRRHFIPACAGGAAAGKWGRAASLVVASRNETSLSIRAYSTSALYETGHSYCRE
jgi:hypothetical protein